MQRPQHSINITPSNWLLKGRLLQHIGAHGFPARSEGGMSAESLMHQASLQLGAYLMPATRRAVVRPDTTPETSILSGLCCGFWAAVTVRVHLVDACPVAAAGEPVACGQIDQDAMRKDWHWSKHVQVNDLIVFCLQPGA